MADLSPLGAGGAAAAGFPVFGAVTLGLGIAKGFADSSRMRDQNRMMVSSIDQQVADLNSRIGALKKAAAAKKGVVRGRYGERVRDVNSMLGNTIFDLLKSEEKVTSQSDLYRPEGSLTEEERNRAGRDYKTQRESLTEWLGTTLSDIESRTSGQITEAESQIKQLKIQRDAADEATRGLGAYLPF